MNVHDDMEARTDVYVAGGLSADERRDVDQHAAGCAACAARLKDAQDFAAWAKGLIAIDAPPADLENRLIERFRAAGQVKKRRFRVGGQVLKISITVAATAALIFLGDVFTAQQSVQGYDGYLSLNSKLIVQSNSAAAEARLRALSSASADYTRDFWALDASELRPLTIAPSATQSASATLRFQARSGGFESFFGRDLSRTGWSEEGERMQRGLQASLGDDAGVDVLNRANKSLPDISGEMAKNPSGATSESLAAKLSEDKGYVPSASLAIETDAIKDRKEKLVALKDSAMAKLPPALPDPGPQVSTLAVAKEVEQFEERPNQDNRKIVRNAEATIEVDSYEATYKKLGEMVAAEKGYIAGGDIQKMANGKIQANVTIRIPADRFEGALARIKDLGTVRYQNIKSEDVTKEYFDLDARLKSKELLAERLRKLLAEGKGSVKDLMEVEVQLGGAQEAIDKIKGEMRYYDSVVSMSTLILGIVEKDLSQPFEYVQTLSANLALTARDPDDAYARAQKEITNAGGQVVDSRMNRQNDGSSTGTIRARVDADKFSSLRESLKKLGVVTNDTINQQKTARGGNEGTSKIDAPLRKEQALLDLSVSSPPIFVTRRSQIIVETGEVESAYQNARRAVEGAGGKIVNGSLTGYAAGSQAKLQIQVDADKFSALVDSLKTAGKVKNANVNSVLPAASADGSSALLRERAEIDFALVSPQQLIAEEHGLMKSIRDTFANSWAGLLWSVEKLFVGISMIGPWLLLLVLAWVFWRRRKKPAPVPPSK
ncbi:MAG TPA: DUF4349 domain-containing protein [Planctomycetota bacterium]|nr:DUF4349 domain-containing protein [Planctomycetota bacterium]